MNSTTRFSNLWHPYNRNVLSYDKSTIESNKHPNCQQWIKLNFTKLWSFSNSTGRFSNLKHLDNWNVLSCDKSIIESSKYPNSKQKDKSKCLNSFNWNMELGNAFKFEQNVKFNSFNFNNFPISLGSSLRALQFERINVRKSL